MTGSTLSAKGTACGKVLLQDKEAEGIRNRRRQSGWSRERGEQGGRDERAEERRGLGIVGGDFALILRVEQNS